MKKIEAGSMITANAWAWKFLDSIGIDPSNVRRVVIDATIDCPLTIYIEQYGDERALTVEPPSKNEVVIKCGS